MSARIEEDNTEQIKALVSGARGRAEKRAADEGKTVAVALCPVGEGEEGVHLFQTIEVVAVGPHTELVAGDPGQGVDHAVFVEMGTENTPSQPYMGPAVPVIRSSLEAFAAEEIRKALG